MFVGVTTVSIALFLADVKHFFEKGVVNRNDEKQEETPSLLIVFTYTCRIPLRRRNPFTGLLRACYTLPYVFSSPRNDGGSCCFRHCEERSYDKVGSEPRSNPAHSLRAAFLIRNKQKNTLTQPK